MIIIAVIVGLVVIVRFMQPKLTPAEKYLLHVIPRKSPQMDNIRLFMWIKMVIHSVANVEELDFQKKYLDDAEQFKMLANQLYGFGAFALFPLLGYEAVNWHMETFSENALIDRVAAVPVIRRYPHNAAVLEELLIQAPEAVSSNYF